MESYEKLTEYIKESHQTFDFFISCLQEDKDINNNYIVEILAMPKLPLLGHYNKNDYIFGQISSLISFQIDICQGKDKKEIPIKYSDFILPSNISKYLNVFEELEIDNNTKNKDKPALFIPKEKINFYFIISKLPSSINFNNRNESLLLNIVPHLYYNKDKEIDFSESKRQVFEKPITLFTIEDDGDNDISSLRGKNDIDINNLRLEYSSIHLKRGSLAFSPNNLKFRLNIKKDLSQFYLITTLKENDYHSVFYFITCNNDKSNEKMKNILLKSNNLKDIIINIKSDFNDCTKIIDNLTKIFRI